MLLALTTSEELFKQLTIIFGISGRLNINVGAIRGLGELTESHTEQFISNFMNFLNEYNSMMIDYTDCKIYSLESELENPISDSKIRLFPKSMILLPGEYKECNSFLLILSPELSLIDFKKAKEANDLLCRTFYEIEEAIDRPELDEEQKKAILREFAQRFSYELQGNVIEEKWNKKLVGIKNEKELTPYLTMTLQSEQIGEKQNQIIKIPKFLVSQSLGLAEENQLEFFKYQIIQGSAFIIAQNTLRMVDDLLELANLSTLNDLQQEWTTIMLQDILSDIDLSKKGEKISKIQDLLNNTLASIQKKIDILHQIFSTFTMSGKQGEIRELIDDIQKECKKKAQKAPLGSNETIFWGRCNKIIDNFLRTQFPISKTEKKIRVSDLKDLLLYIEENARYVLDLIKRGIPSYSIYFTNEEFCQKFVELSEIEFEAKTNRDEIILSRNLVLRFLEEIKNSIELNKGAQINTIDDGYLQGFKNLVKKKIDPFCAKITFKIEDILDFLSIVFKEDPQLLAHINNLKRFRHEIFFIWGFILRSSSIQRFIKELPMDFQWSPAQFAQSFMDYLQKRRLAAIELIWQTHFYSYINEFISTFQPQFEIDSSMDNPWSKSQIISEFINYLGLRIEEETTLEGFLKPMKKYLDDIAIKNVQDRKILEIRPVYLKAFEIIDQIPLFLRQVLNKTIENLQQDTFQVSVIRFLGEVPADGEILMTLTDRFTKGDIHAKSYYHYLLRNELQSYIKLKAHPRYILFENQETKTTRDVPIIHSIDFTSLGESFLKMTFSIDLSMFESGMKQP